jgi:hypothetical protein
MLTPENLGMIKRLQPLFKEKMGEWQEGDEYYLLHLEYSKFYCDQCDTTNYLNNSSVLRIPKPIDWQNPERGLWGMVDWKKFVIVDCWAYDHMYIKRRPKNENDWSKFRAEADPFTALLKALVEQEGV